MPIQRQYLFYSLHEQSGTESERSSAPRVTLFLLTSIHNSPFTLCAITQLLICASQQKGSIYHTEIESTKAGFLSLNRVRLEGGEIKEIKTLEWPTAEWLQNDLRKELKLLVFHSGCVYVSFDAAHKTASTVSAQILEPLGFLPLFEDQGPVFMTRHIYKCNENCDLNYFRTI